MPYVNGAILDDGWDNPVVRQKTRELFERLPERYVLECGKLSVAKKRFYFEVLGKPVPHMSHVPYVRYLASRAVRAVRTQGVAFLAEDMGRFVGNKIRKSGMEKAEGE